MTWKQLLKAGAVIPAHPLALTAQRKLDERRQRGLTRYYLAAGAQGIAVGVHTTQFAIHDPASGLLRPVLELAAAECADLDVIRIAGICGFTQQAAKEAALAAELGYHVGLVSLADLSASAIPELLDHIKIIAAILPVMGFYLQPAVSGRHLPYEFWRGLSEIGGVIGIKIAPFSRYHTMDVIRGVLDSGRADQISLYTGNDDNIVADLLTDFHYGQHKTSFAGGLLGQWAVWTHNAVGLLNQVKQIRVNQSSCRSLLTLGAQLTDANSAIFDVANHFEGCIPGIHEILVRQGLLAGRWCLNPEEDLSNGQLDEIDRVLQRYPHLSDESFIEQHIHEWLH